MLVHVYVYVIIVLRMQRPAAPGIHHDQDISGELQQEEEREGVLHRAGECGDTDTHTGERQCPREMVRYSHNYMFSG